jgi:hypothetical protein
MSNWPPPKVLIEKLREKGMKDIVEYMLKYGFLAYCQ